MIFENMPVGKLAQFGGCEFFFGNRNSSIEALEKRFPNLQFIRLKQTHSDIVVESSHDNSTLVEADAHLTSKANIALCINTADCVPVLLHDKKSNVIAAIHAGWRGVAQRILPKTISKMNTKELLIVIGPHICFESFEVGSDVRDQILASIKNPSSKHFVEISTEKSRVHLLEVLFSQLEEFSISSKNIQVIEDNTVLNTDYHSFRRDKQDAGRQISFIARTSGF